MLTQKIDPALCSEWIYGSLWSSHQCERKPVVERDGKPYCKIHDPEYKKAKAAKWRADQDALYARKRQQWAVQEARDKATEGLSLEELQKLTPGMCRKAIVDFSPESGHIILPPWDLTVTIEDE